MKKLFMSVFCLLAIITGGYKAEASGGLRFSVKPNIPETQINKEVSYFDLLVEPNQTQEITVSMKNTSDEPVTIQPQINSAITNSSGVVEYSNHGNKERIFDKSLKYNIEDLVKIEENEVTLNPAEEYELKVTISAPAEKFAGVIAGGLYLSQKENNAAESNKKTGDKTATNLKNLFGYQIALLIREDEAAVEPEIVFNKASADQLNGRNSVSLKVRNTSATYINKATYQAKLKRKNSDTVIAKTEQKDMQFAPNTIFDLMLPLKGAEFQAGEYVLSGSIIADDNKWDINKEFSITREQAAKYNESDPDVEEADYTMIIILIAVVAVLVLTALYLILKNRKQKAQIENLKK